MFGGLRKQLSAARFDWQAASVPTRRLALVVLFVAVAAGLALGQCGAPHLIPDRPVLGGP